MKSGTVERGTSHRATCTIAVFAAVRVGDYDRAERLAVRFETSARIGSGASLSAWVRSHRPAGTIDTTAGVAVVR